MKTSPIAWTFLLVHFFLVKILCLIFLLLVSVVDPDPRDPHVFWPPRSGSGSISQRQCCGSGIRDGRKSASGSRIRDEQPGSYFLELRNFSFAFFGVWGSGMETVRIRDPRWKKVGSGINIPDPQHWSEVWIRIWILLSSC
jgi:hypothetical protein